MKDSKRSAGWIALVLLVATALAIVIAPVLIIFPFKHQTPGGLKLAYMLRSWSPILTLLAAAGSIALAVFVWRHSKRWWSKTLLVILTLLILPPAWFARQNHFEWMFHPLPGPGFVKAENASFVSDTDKVIAIDLNGEAAAYPVRQMAYHHVVQDEVGGIPIVATY